MKIFAFLHINGGRFPHIRQFVKFGLVGVSNTLVSNIICYAFIFIDKSLIYVGQAAGFIISVLNAYYWNNRYVFKNAERSAAPRLKDHLRPLARVYLAYGATVILGFGLTWAMRDRMGVSEWFIPLILLFICTPINFFTNKLWAFKGRG